jgi:DeoR family transcriptional regulator, fructose operon transcriptional repressor
MTRVNDGVDGPPTTQASSGPDGASADRVPSRSSSRAAAAARHDAIAGWLEAEGRIDVVRAADRLGVAQETVRRDLRTMETDGRLHRVHGGAIPVLPRPTASLTGRESRYVELGRLLWARLPRDGTLLIGTGAPALGLAEAISSDPPVQPGLTIVTNYLDAAIVLSRVQNLAVYNIGGTVSSASRGQEGDWALTELHRLRTDLSVVCPAGISVTEGLSDLTPSGAAICRAQTNVGRRVIALVDAAAVGRSAFVTFATIDEIDEVAVAGTVPDKQLRPFRDRGVPLTVVPTSD